MLSSLRSRLVLLVLIASLPALATILYTARKQEQTATANARAEALRLARVAASSHTAALESTRLLLDALSRLRAVRLRDGEACSELFADLIGRHPEYGNLGAVTPDGRVYCSALPLAAPVNLADRAYIRAALANRRFAIGEYQIGRITGVPGVNAGMPVHDLDGHLVAVVFAALSLNTFDRILAGITLPPGAHALVLDRVGTVLLRYPEDRTWIGRPAADAANLPFPQIAQGTVHTRGRDSLEYLYAIAKTTLPSGERGLEIAIGMPTEALQAPVRAAYQQSLLWLILISLLAVLSAWALGQWFIGTRVERLLAATQRVALGDFSVRANLTPASDELGRLGQGFDQMAASLERQTEELHRSETQLRQAQKIEAIGQLAGGVAHDFNNLLAAIIGYSELLLTQLPADSPYRPDVEEIDRAALRGADLTRQLLAFSRRQVLEPTVLQPNDLIVASERLLRRLLREDVHLTTLLAPDLGYVRADRVQLEQVLINLVVNARDAMPDGGHLTIETQNVDLDEEYASRHVEATSGSYVMLAITDTGVGIPADVRERIFEPFFTTKPEGEGTGLGLATVYGIVKQSGGTIWVYSEPDRGTTFKVYLPRVTAPAPGSSLAAASPGSAVGGSETVLLVEDDQGVRALTRRILEGNGYTVLEAPRPEEALALGAGYEGPIHLILTDVVMPGMNGVELVRRLRKTRPSIQAVYMSGYTHGTVGTEEIHSTGDLFIQKPFTPAKLLQRIREVMEAGGGK
ncbi:MAG: ATP-binding protein [Gemmatimonadales bacterium]